MKHFQFDTVNSSEEPLRKHVGVAQLMADALEHSDHRSAAQGQNRSATNNMRNETEENRQPVHKLVKSTPSANQVLQPKWDMETVLSILLFTESGNKAIQRLVEGDIKVVKHSKNAVMPKFVVVGDEVVKRPNPQFMDGFGQAKKIHISDEVDDYHAAAMIVHESTHSLQKQEGGIYYEWKKRGKPEEEKAQLEYAMEKEAHLNQYHHELQIGVYSDKLLQVINFEGDDVDKDRLRHQLDDLYQTGENLSELEMEARQATVEARKQPLQEFMDDVVDTYGPKSIEEMIEIISEKEANREKEIINPYAFDMPDYGKSSTESGHMPYIA